MYTFDKFILLSFFITFLLSCGHIFAQDESKKQQIITNVIEQMNTSIKNNPQNAEMYAARAGAYMMMGDTKQSIVDYDKSIELNPKNEMIYGNRGLVYFKKGDYKEAISDFTSAINLKSPNSVLYYNRAIAYYNNHEFRKAWLDIHKAEALGIRIEPKVINVLKKVTEQKNKVINLSKNTTEQKNNEPIEKIDLKW